MRTCYPSHTTSTPSTSPSLPPKHFSQTLKKEQNFCVPAFNNYYGFTKQRHFRDRQKSTCLIKRRRRTNKPSTMTIQTGPFRGRTPDFGSPPPTKFPHQLWTPQPMRKNNNININNNNINNNNKNMNNNNNNNSNAVLQFWQSQEKREEKIMTTRMTSWASSPRLNCIEVERGFMPSDVASDPRKKEFLTDLSRKIFSPAVKSKSLVQLHQRLTMVRPAVCHGQRRNCFYLCI